MMKQQDGYLETVNRWLKKNIIESVDVDRMGGVSWLFGIQRILSVPQELIDACKFKFIPYNVDMSVLKTILINIGIIVNMVRSTDSNKIRKIYNILHDKLFRWLLINRDGVGDKNTEYIDLYSPTSDHLESKSNLKTI